MISKWYVNGPNCIGKKTECVYWHQLFQYGFRNFILVQMLHMIDIFLTITIWLLLSKQFENIWLSSFYWQHYETTVHINQIEGPKIRFHRHKTHSQIDMFSIIFIHGYDRSCFSFKTFNTETEMFWEKADNNIAVHGLAPCITRSAADIALIMHDQLVLIRIFTNCTITNVDKWMYLYIPKLMNSAQQEFQMNADNQIWIIILDFLVSSD